MPSSQLFGLVLSAVEGGSDRGSGSLGWSQSRGRRGGGDGGGLDEDFQAVGVGDLKVVGKAVIAADGQDAFANVFGKVDVVGNDQGDGFGFGGEQVKPGAGKFKLAGVGGVFPGIRGGGG